MPISQDDNLFIPVSLPKLRPSIFTTNHVQKIEKVRLPPTTPCAKSMRTVTPHHKRQPSFVRTRTPFHDSSEMVMTQTRNFNELMMKQRTRTFDRIHSLALSRTPAHYVSKTKGNPYISQY